MERGERWRERRRRRRTRKKRERGEEVEVDDDEKVEAPLLRRLPFFHSSSLSFSFFFPKKPHPAIAAMSLLSSALYKEAGLSGLLRAQASSGTCR